MNQSLAISFSARPGSEREPQDLLKIEQEPWKPYTGKVTKANLARWLASILYGEAYQHQIDCGMTGDALVCTVYAYPKIAGLVYRMHTSWGELSERVIEEYEHEEIINVSLADVAETEYPAREILSYAWAGSVYGADGSVVPQPAIQIGEDGFPLGEEVYGALRVKYLVERHVYILNAPRRENAIQNLFSAVVYGVYAGGISWKIIDPPPGLENFEADPDAECGFGGNSGTANYPDDPESTAIPRRANVEQAEDYCSREVISRTVNAF